MTPVCHVVCRSFTSHARELLRGKWELAPEWSDKFPALWTVLQADSSNVKVQLYPICARPGHLHVVGADSDGVIILLSSLTQDEAKWLQSVAEGVKMCTPDANVDVDFATKFATKFTAKRAELAEKLGMYHKHLGRPLCSAWRATSTAPLWVCKKHYTKVYRPPNDEDGDASPPPPTQGSDGRTNAATVALSVDTADVEVTVHPSAAAGASDEAPAPSTQA